MVNLNPAAPANALLTVMVFDAVTREPVVGATVNIRRIIGPPGSTPAVLVWASGTSTEFGRAAFFLPTRTPIGGKLGYEVTIKKDGYDTAKERTAHPFEQDELIDG